MQPANTPKAPVTVEYDSHGKRVRKSFADHFQARRFYAAKHKADKNPHVVGEGKLPAQPGKFVALYIRVSTVEQNEAGQRAEIEKWVAGNGINPAAIRWYVDKGKSGDNLKRPAFEAMQKAIFNGEIGTVVVWKLDRLSRNLRDGLNILCDWCDKALRIVAITQQIDFNGTIGKMLAAVLLGIAEMEQETRRERQRAGIEAAKKAGKYLGRRPGTTLAKPHRAIELRDKGLTVDEIGSALGASRTTVFRYLRTAKAKI